MREHLLGGQLPRVAPPRRAEAVDALQVAGVGPLPGEADGGVEPGLELVAHRRAPRRGRLEGAVDPRRELRRTRGVGVRRGVAGLAQEARPGQRAEGLLEARPAGRGDAGRVEGGAGAGVAAHGAHQAHQLRGPQQGEAPVAVVVGQGAERLGPQGDLGVELVAGQSASKPGAASGLIGVAESSVGAGRSVDAAHAVDGHLFDEQLFLDRPRPRRARRARRSRQRWRCRP